MPQLECSCGFIARAPTKRDLAIIIARHRRRQSGTNVQHAPAPKGVKS